MKPNEKALYGVNKIKTYLFVYSVIVNDEFTRRLYAIYEQTRSQPNRRVR